MELLVLAFCILLLGGFITFFAKDYKSNIILSIFMLIAFAGLLIPCKFVINTGNYIPVEAPIRLFYQNMSCIIDPLSAFFAAILALIGIFYVACTINQHKNVMVPALKTSGICLLFFSALLLTTSMNLFYIFIAFFVMNILLVILDNKTLTDSRKQSYKQLFSSVSLGVISFAVIVTLLYIGKVNLTEYLQILGPQKSFANDIFVLMFIGAGFPVMLSNFLIEPAELKSRTNASLIISNVTYLMYYFILVRLMSVGVLPFKMCAYIVFSVVTVVILTALVKLIRSSSLHKDIVAYDTISKGMSLFGLLIGVYGYLYATPGISILGFLSSFIFFINTIISNILITSDLICNNVLPENADNVKPVSAIGILNYMGSPLTLGFAGWLTMFAAAIIGTLPKNTELRFLSVVIALIISVVFIGLIYKAFKIFKSKINKQIEFSFSVKSIRLPNFREIAIYAVAVFVFVSGIFLKSTAKILFCPVSYIVGGTKFVDIFNVLENYATFLNKLFLIFIAAFIVYAALKVIVLKITQNK